ncbi:NAD(P)/FAD-dependent oxidoreductase [Amphibacillus indicireducens]|uniref:NAD(P)/FAD-dependent oxidoreductase n=1 Tax=Amphibacillus indicireducens TaxID=1076330 RepID=A0ABP7VIM8_9BACI
MTPIKVVILGAGYAGLTAVMKLQKQKTDQPIELTLINKNQYHYQTIWLHRNAVGSHSVEDSTFDLRELLDLSKVNLVQETVTSLDPNQQIVKTEQGSYRYDYLFVGLGSVIDSFQIPGLSEHACSITTLERATQLYERMLTMLDHYRQTAMNRELQVAIGGGGFTGVVLLGELTERLPLICAEKGIDRKKIKLLSIEHESTVLPEFDLELGEYAMQQLEARGVEFRLKTKIKSLTDKSMKIEQSGIVEDIPIDLFVWTAGVKGHPLIEQANFKTTLGRVEVEADLSAPGYSNIFLIGDVAIVRDQTGRAYLPNADIAIQKAKTAVDNLLIKLSGSDQTKAFQFKNRGTIASIGAKDAIGVTAKGQKIFGRAVALLKKLADYQFLYQIGGWKLVRMQLRKRK